MSDVPECRNELKARLNGETSKIAWQELERHYAQGAVVVVAKAMDLIEVACEFSADNTTLVEGWLKAGSVYKADDELAAQWLQRDATHWAVVVAPWVLVQEVDGGA